MAVLGLFPYVCIVTYSYRENSFFLKLKTIALSASELVYYDQLLPYLCIRNKVFSKLLYSSAFNVS